MKVKIMMSPLDLFFDLLRKRSRSYKTPWIRIKRKYPRPIWTNPNAFCSWTRFSENRLLYFHAHSELMWIARLLSFRLFRLHISYETSDWKGLHILFSQFIVFYEICLIIYLQQKLSILSLTFILLILASSSLIIIFGAFGDYNNHFSEEIYKIELKKGFMSTYFVDYTKKIT